MAEITLDKTVKWLLATLALIAVILFILWIVKPSLFEWIKSQPEYNYTHDAEIKLTADQLVDKVLCQVPIGVILEETGKGNTWYWMTAGNAYWYQFRYFDLNSKSLQTIFGKPLTGIFYSIFGRDTVVLFWEFDSNGRKKLCLETSGDGSCGIVFGEVTNSFVSLAHESHSSSSDNLILN